MPPGRFSRYLFTSGVLDDNNVTYLTQNKPYRFVDLPDNTQVTVVQGDDLFSLAATYFAPLDAARDLWWIIADFQPDPIIDPTAALDIGRVIFIPSLRTLNEEVFNEARRSQRS